MCCRKWLGHSRDCFQNSNGGDQAAFTKSVYETSCVLDADLSKNILKPQYQTLRKLDTSQSGHLNRMRENYTGPLRLPECHLFDRKPKGNSYSPKKCFRSHHFSGSHGKISVGTVLTSSGFDRIVPFINLNKTKNGLIPRKKPPILEFYSSHPNFITSVSNSRKACARTNTSVAQRNTRE